LNDILVQYTGILQNCGFYPYYEGLDGAIYINEDTRDSVILEVSVDSNNNAVINITVEQWPENSEN
jgi:hypothetical protein